MSSVTSQSVHFVEGHAGTRAAAPSGGHDPTAVLVRGWHPDDFAEGPLTRAMQEGGILYVEEINRAPADVLGDSRVQACQDLLRREGDGARLSRSSRMCRSPSSTA